MQRSTNKQPIIMDKNPWSSISEAYRSLRTSIEFAVDEHSIQTIAVASSLQGEGKTTTAINLAIACAEAERTVLLIDADIRKPTLQDIFLKNNTKGLYNILINQCSLHEATEKTHISHLEILTAGSLPTQSSNLLTSANFTSLLEQAKEQYDFVIVDTPALLLQTDAQIIASRCDGVLLVVHAGKVKKQAVRKSKILLEHVKAKTLGVVLNKVKTKKRKVKEIAY